MATERLPQLTSEISGLKRRILLLTVNLQVTTMTIQKLLCIPNCKARSLCVQELTACFIYII